MKKNQPNVVSKEKILDATKNITNKGKDVTKKTTNKIFQIMHEIRRLIHYVIDGDEGSFISFLYNIFIVFVAILSVIPFFLVPGTVLPSWLQWILDFNSIWITIFIIDYSLRWLVADFSIKKGWKSFFLYPFTIWSIIDLFGIIPFVFNLKQLRILATFRLFRIVRIFPKLREGFNLIIRSVFEKWKVFLVILITLVIFLFIGALIIFNIEYEQNPNIGSYTDALWYVFVTITTIGFGDIYPYTSVGRVITSFLALFGIALISIITAIFATGFNEIDMNKELKHFVENNEASIPTINYFKWDVKVDDSEHNILKLREEDVFSKVNEEQALKNIGQDYIISFEYDREKQTMVETIFIIRK